VTTRKLRALPEAGIAPAAALFQAMAEHAPVLLWTFRPDGGIERVNARVTEYAGLGEAELRDLGWHNTVHPQDLPYGIQRWKAAIASGEPFEVQFRLRRSDGKYRWHQVAARPVRDASGRILRWVGSGADVEDQLHAGRVLAGRGEGGDAAERLRSIGREIKARRMAEQALSQSSGRVRAFLDSMPAIAWIKDSQLRYVWVSRSYERMLGKTLAQLRHRRVDEVWPEGLALRHRHADEAVLRRDGPMQMVSRWPLADGGIARLLVVKFPLADETGAAGVAGIGFEMAGDEAVARTREEALERLSDRELQVLRMIVDGYTSAEVAAELSLSPKSVDTYRSRLMAKLEISDLPGLVKYAIRQRLTSVK
jgi:PAS domain S-box-containing protein